MEVIAPTILAIAQSELNTNAELRQIRELADIERAQTERNHIAELKQAVELHNEAAHNEWELYDASMSVAVDLATRETMRDVKEQRQFLNQTILVVDALMFSCAFLSISQPQFVDGLPMDTWMAYLFTCSTGLGVLLLTLSMWAAFKVQSRMGGYSMSNPSAVYVCGSKHADFNGYFACHCETLRIVAVATFFLGTCAVLLSAVAVQAIQAWGRFNDPTVAVVFTVLLLLCLGGTIAFELSYSDNTEMRADYGGLAGAVEDSNVQPFGGEKDDGLK